MGSFIYTSHAGFIFLWEVFCGKFFLHIPYWLLFLIIYMRGVSLTHPVLSWFLWKTFHLHIPCRLLFFNLRSFTYTSRVGFIFIWGVSLTHPMLALFFIWVFYTSHAWFIFIWWVSLTHPVLALIISAHFLLRIPYLLDFSLGSLFYTSYSGFNSIWGVSLTHPVLASRAGFPCWLQFYLGSFSYTPWAGFICIRGVSLTHTVLDSFLSREFLLHIPCWL